MSRHKRIKEIKSVPTSGQLDYYIHRWSASTLQHPYLFEQSLLRRSVDHNGFFRNHQSQPSCSQSPTDGVISETVGRSSKTKSRDPTHRCSFISYDSNTPPSSSLFLPLVWSMMHCVYPGGDVFVLSFPCNSVTWVDMAQRQQGKNNCRFPCFRSLLTSSLTQFHHHHHTHQHHPHPTLTPFSFVVLYHPAVHLLGINSWINRHFDLDRM